MRTSHFGGGLRNYSGAGSVTPTEVDRSPEGFLQLLDLVLAMLLFWRNRTILPTSNPVHMMPAWHPLVRCWSINPQVPEMMSKSVARRPGN